MEQQMTAVAPIDAVRRVSIEFTRSGTAEVLTPDGYDPDLTDAAQDALHGLSPSSREGKYSRWLERFLNFEMHADERYDAFLDETVTQGRRRMKAFLRAVGCIVGPARGRDDGSFSVEREHGCTTDVEIAIIAVRALYRSLVEGEVTLAEDNPLDVNGWREAAARRLADGLSGPDDHGHMSEQSGHQFRMLNRDWYPPHLHDPGSAAAKVMAAIEAHGRWPNGAVLLTRALIEGGARFEDTHALHAADWAVSSRFGRGILAPDKGSQGRRVKFIVISADTRDRIAASFDARHAADPIVPDMAELRRLLTEGRLDELMKWPLFPNSKGKPFKYGNYNDDYFRPSMTVQGAEVVLDSSLGSKIVTPHWLRHASVEADLADIFGRELSEEELEAELKELQEYYGWRTDQIQRYAAHFLASLRLKRRIAFADRRNAAEEVKPRLRRMHQSGSSLLSRQIASRHEEMQE